MKKIMFEEKMFLINRDDVLEVKGLGITLLADKGSVSIRPLNNLGNPIPIIIPIYKDSIKEVIEALQQHESDRIKGNLYRVKVEKGTTINPDALKDGYLAFCGEIQEYGLREAKRKAKAFGGEVERVC